MKICLLASGSKGNAVIIESGQWSIGVSRNCSVYRPIFSVSPVFTSWIFQVDVS